MLVSILTIVYALTVANPPQCDAATTFSNGDDCVTGANIGLGLFLLLGYCMFLVSTVLAACMLIISHRKKYVFVDRHIYFSLASVIVLVGCATLTLISLADDVLRHLIKF